MKDHFATLEELEEYVKQLKEGESLVGLIDMDVGAFLFIGDDYVNHRWAVTEDELKCLYKILQRRYKKQSEE